MIDRDEITRRYLSCFPGLKPTELAGIIGVKHPTVYQWVSSKRGVPWEKLKDLADAEGISWDWLLEGAEPKFRKRRRKAVCTPFDRHGINQRFLSLFSALSQQKIGDLLGVSQMTVYRWHHAISPVPWEKLKYAVDTQSVTWEWLLEGR